MLGQLKGFAKNGLDSSTIINLIVVFAPDFVAFRTKYPFPPNLFYYHDVSYPEVIGVLINRHQYTKLQAKKAFAQFKDVFSPQVIKRIAHTDKDFENLVRTTNQRIAKRAQDEKLLIGEQDVIIIAGFKRENIDYVHSGDAAFLRTCKEIGLNVWPTPKKHLSLEKD